MKIQMKIAAAVMGAAVLIGAGLSLSSAAEPARRREIRHRQHRQHERIKQGVKSGELTKEEAQGLRQEQKEIREEKHEARADGHVTREEAKEINQMQNKTSQDIYHENHDAEKR